MTTPNLVEHLRHPSAYPWNPERVDLIETHISWVFLAGDRVLKIKKPVDLGFVDFSDLTLRRNACDQEVELNRRLTSNVYIDVVPITQTENHHHVSMQGAAAVEWGTLMRRLPADRMLDQMIQNGAIAADAIPRIAERLIPFHLDAAKPCADFSCQAIAVVTENLDQLRSLGDGLLGTELLRLVDSAMREFIHRERVLFESRSDKWIVDGHGDLRCEHICLESNGAVQIFDCVEFSRDLRCADVASDLAFLVMDLRRLHADDLGDQLLAWYRESDADLPDAIVRFYAVHRALVRAKVACIGVQSLGSDLRADHVAEAADYLNLATSFVMRTPPALIAVTGLSGTGKSTAANAIARVLGATSVSSDAVRKHLAQIEPNTRADSDWQSGIYDPSWTRRTYERMRELARESVSNGETVVLDATFLDAGEREHLAKLSSSLSAPLVIVEITCDESVTLRRIRDRANQKDVVSDASEEIYLRQRQELEVNPPQIPGNALACRIDNSAEGPVAVWPVVEKLLEAHLVESI